MAYTISETNRSVLFDRKLRQRGNKIIAAWRRFLVVSMPVRIQMCREQQSMETETIIYYHPMQEQTLKTCAAKKHWWKDAELRERTVPAQDGQSPFTLVDCPVPPFYYKKKLWRPEVLSESMEAVLHRTPGMPDAYLHPQIMTYVSETYERRWETRKETIQTMAAYLLSQYAASCVREQGQVTVLLGTPEDTEWQMVMTRHLLEPYLSRINGLRFDYQEKEGTDIWEEEAPHLEEYYYEYGLVPQLTPYLSKEEGYRCGRQKCAGVILDYSMQPGYPRISPGLRTVYVDLVSCQKKERVYSGKGTQILYVSPLKYLDTMVKNSYDRLVH